MTDEALQDHLVTGTTTVCRAWRVTRRDGTVLGFTDHDGDLMIDSVVHRAESGLSARAVQQTTGLSVDNTEAIGVLADSSIREDELAAGRFDGAEVRIWLVNWADPDARKEVFRGSLGEVSRKGTEFRAELRGLSEPLNQPIGFAYTRQCSAVVGDKRCRFDLTLPGYVLERPLAGQDMDGRVLTLADAAGFDERWFEGGRLEILSGVATGLVGMVKSDRMAGDLRRIELWQSLRAPLSAGDLIRITAGCDKTAETCRTKFGNFLNFRGFPQMPGDDWITSYPRQGQPTGGGSLTAGSTGGF